MNAETFRLIINAWPEVIHAHENQSKLPIHELCTNLPSMDHTTARLETLWYTIKIDNTILRAVVCEDCLPLHHAIINEMSIEF